VFLIGLPRSSVRITPSGADLKRLISASPWLACSPVLNKILRILAFLFSLSGSSAPHFQRLHFQIYIHWKVSATTRGGAVFASFPGRCGSPCRLMARVLLSEKKFADNHRHLRRYVSMSAGAIRIAEKFAVGTAFQLSPMDAIIRIDIANPQSGHRRPSQASAES